MRYPRRRNEDQTRDAFGVPHRISTRQISAQRMADEDHFLDAHTFSPVFQAGEEKVFGAGDAGWDGGAGGGREEGRGWAGGEAHAEPVKEECTAGGGGGRGGDGFPVTEEEAVK